MSSVDRLTRMRWGVRAVLALGVAASVTANVLHARPNPVSQAIAGWPPIALLLTVELISRIPVHRRGLATVRIVATALIASIAAWVSYWHMAGVAARYGETGTSAYLLPLSVDGLIVVASVCLVELGGRLAITVAAGPQTGHDGTPTDAGAVAGPLPAATRLAEPDAVPGGQVASPPPPEAPAEPPVAAATAATTADMLACLDAPARVSPVVVADTPSTSPQLEPANAYKPTSDDDAAMYRAWLRGADKGQDPSGADLARAAGRANDATGIGRRAARRYREAHAKQRRADGRTDGGESTQARQHKSHQHNGHELTGTRA